MKKSDELSESILKEWLTVSSVIQNDRIVKDMPFNEALVCNHLMYSNDPGHLTLTQLCHLTGIRKSLMNRILKSLIAKGLIVYADWDGDRRSKPVKLNPDRLDDFLDVHYHSVDVVKHLVEYWGMEKSAAIEQSLKDISGGFRHLYEEDGK